MKNPKIIQLDSWLNPYKEVIKQRIQLAESVKKKLLGNTHLSLTDFANGYNYYGYQIENNLVIFREWMPNATKVYLVGDFNNWTELDEYELSRINSSDWELKIALSKIQHKDKYKLKVYWPNGSGNRISAWAKRLIQDDGSKLFNTQFWNPPIPYQWKNDKPIYTNPPFIYEAHVGMAGENEKVSTFSEFRQEVLPRIKKLGYNVVQLMAIQEHPYYGSFGYHVSSLFAPSSRFGSPEDLKELIDEAHKMGMKVIMDLVHSHAVKNENEGLGLYDGTRYQFFHEGAKGEHPAWDSFCFNYGKQEVIHFLLSNIKYWLTEFNFDGFRFDGVTSMLYNDHGLGKDFTSYENYFDGTQDEEALSYLWLANSLIHEINEQAISIAEEMSGYPGLASPIAYGGLGFDYRLSMGIPDFWIKTLKEKKDEEWNLGQLFHELTTKRADEKTISYTESHDQALVGDKTIAFRLMDKDMYFNMLITQQNIIIDRGMALHKMIRLITMATNGGGYLNFMGNEFGHPEWIDFPRQGNNWSYKYAIRQWSLVDREDLKYKLLNNFDEAIVKLVQDKNISGIYPINIQHIDEGNKVISFSRANLIFVFNFNPVNSFTYYGIQVPQGKYKYILGSDELNFGGFGRIDESLQYKTLIIDGEGINHELKLYLPARTAIVLEKLPVKNVYDRIKNYIDS